MSVFLKPICQAHIRQQHDFQVPPAGKSYVQVCVLLSAPARSASEVITTEMQYEYHNMYLHQARIANQIEVYQDFHPLVMFTDVDPGAQFENPFTGNDRFVVYEDGGRPFDIQLALGWQPTCGTVRRIAGQMLEALAYLFSKKVVHRKLQLGTVVFNPVTSDVKLISLGEAKYIEALDYENKMSEFERDWQGASDGIGSKRRAHSRGVSPPAPCPILSLKNSKLYVHPSIRQVSQHCR